MMTDARKKTQGSLQMHRRRGGEGRCTGTVAAFREGKRRGRCPYEHLGLKLPSYRFWDLLWMPIPAAAAI